MKYKQCHLLPSINRRVTPQGLRAQTICGSERDFLRIRRRSDDGGGGSGILISARQRRMASLHIHIRNSVFCHNFFGGIFSPFQCARGTAGCSSPAKKAACSLLHQFRPHRLQAWSEKEDKCASDTHAHVQRDRSARVSVVVCRLIGPADIHRSRAISIQKDTVFFSARRVFVHGTPGGRRNPLSLSLLAYHPSLREKRFCLLRRV
jgi:hypothetical protein